MRSRCVSRAGVCVLLAMLLSTVLGFAKDGRDFAGYYNVADAVEQGNQVQLTLRVRVFNYSGQDLKGAVVVLHQAAAPGVFGVSKPIKLLPSQKDARVNEQVLIPRHVYEQWQKGLAPEVSIVYLDAHGTRWEKSIQVAPRPVNYF
jgi:hypothetical protein